MGIEKCTIIETSTILGSDYKDHLDGDTGKIIQLFGTSIADIIDNLPEGLTPDITVIDNIYVDKGERRSGKGSKLLNDVIKDNFSNIICLSCAPTNKEFPTEPTLEEYDEYFIKMEKFYNSNGFLSYNGLSGYECSDPYIFIGNDIGLKTYKNMSIDANSEG